MKLTPRQRQVVELSDSGKTAKEIAYDLEISYNTVKAHLQNAAERGGDFRLSVRQAETVRHAAAGLSLKEIAAAMNIGVKTVSTHLLAAYRILHVRNRSQLVLAWQKYLEASE